MTSTLTDEERFVLLLAAQGLTDIVAGRRIGACARTYRRRLVAVSNKIGARNRAHAAALAVALGVIASDDLRPRRSIEHFWDDVISRTPGDAEEATGRD